jgi:hypothetical protein
LGLRRKYKVNSDLPGALVVSVPLYGRGYSASRVESSIVRPNPQPPSLLGKGANFKASLLVGERFGERSKLYRTQVKTAISETL